MQISKKDKNKPGPANKDKVLKEFKEKEKTKALTQGERIDRIEKLLGIQ